MSELFQKMSQSILDGDMDTAAALALQALADGIDPQLVITEGYMPGLDQVGAAFACGESYLPELVMAGEAMKAAVAALEPEMQRLGQQRQTLGKVVLATVEGDIHEIGKSLVGTLLSSSGFQVFDLGVNVKASAIVEKARLEAADIVALSALLTTTMVRQREVIAALDEAGLRPAVKVMVGGAPVTPEWVARIGADGTSQDAIGAVQVARRLVGERE
jgi:corrinoid protein of di/trimethylamine methyltransferase